jgi:nucleoside-diphosphate-sugar epimerase
MHCVVTGVAGFIGSTLAERLIAEGHTVTGIDCFVEYYPKALKLRNLEGLHSQSGFKFIEENLLQADLRKLLTGADWVFHQAAQAGVRASWGKLFDSYTGNNVLATQRLLEACTQCPEVKKIVYASSSSVYGNAERYPTLETDLPKPVSPYGVTKLAAEHLMCLYASEFGLPTTSLRYFTVYGPRQRPDMAFHKFTRAALKGEEIVLYGDGEQSRDFTYVADIVEGNILAAQKGAPGSVFNLGGGAVVTVNEVLRMLEGIVGPLKIKREERQRGDARHTGADTHRARADLGFAPRVSVAEGLRYEAQWMEQLLRSI